MAQGPGPGPGARGPGPGRKARGTLFSAGRGGKFWTRSRGGILDKVGGNFGQGRRGFSQRVPAGVGAKIITCDPENLNPVCFRVKKEPPGDFSANFENEFFIVVHNEKNLFLTLAHKSALPRKQSATPNPPTRPWAPGPGPGPWALGFGPRARALSRGPGARGPGRVRGA